MNFKPGEKLIVKGFNELLDEGWEMYNGNTLYDSFFEREDSDGCLSVILASHVDEILTATGGSFGKSVEVKDDEGHTFLIDPSAVKRLTWMERIKMSNPIELAEMLVYNYHPGIEDYTSPIIKRVYDTRKEAVNATLKALLEDPNHEL